MVLLGDGAPLASLGFGAGARSPAHAQPAERTSSGSTSTLEALRAGRGEHGASYLHATVSSETRGRFGGVELRAVEQHGRVTIQLAAPDASSELALHATLAELRASLSARGLEGVHVELAPPSSSLLGSNDEHSRRQEPALSHDNDNNDDEAPSRVARPASMTHTLAPTAPLDASDCW